MDWFEAARTGAIETLEGHLANGQAVDQPDDAGRTALRVAAEHGQTAAVKLLLERGADPNLDPPGAGRALTAAVRNEHWDTAAALVRGGADPNADGVASIVIATPPKRQLFALMLKRGLDPNGAHVDFGPYVQFALNDSGCCDMLLEAGFDLARYERETGESLLERALATDRKRFDELLERGADVNLPIERRTGQTLLMFLAGEAPDDAHHELIRSLVKRGADVEQTDAEGKTALDVAHERGHETTLALLTRLRDNVRRAKQKAAEAARIAAEKAAEEARLAAEREALRLKRSQAARRGAESRRAAKEAQLARRQAIAKKAAATRASKKKAAAKPKRKRLAPAKQPAKRRSKRQAPAAKSAKRPSKRQAPAVKSATRKKKR